MAKQITHSGENVYDEDFYRNRKRYVKCAVEVVVPLLVEMFRPRSVADVGCGQGDWLRAFMSTGVAKVLGIDGDHVDQNSLEIPRECFLANDLARPPTISRTFDLAISLEVAEHLPPSSSEIFVKFLVGVAPVVVFSAALPGQGGVGHINCRWPDYWIGLFESHGYHVRDPIRRLLWQNEAVANWYQQNILVFASNSALAENEVLRAAPDPRRFPTLIEPAIAWRNPPQVRDAARELFHALHRSLRARLFGRS